MVIGAIKNEMKQLNDLLGYCKDNPEKSREVTEKIEYCNAVLPQMTTEEEIMQYLKDSQLEKNMGSCMKALKEKFGATMDGRVSSAIVKHYINQ